MTGKVIASKGVAGGEGHAQGGIATRAYFSMYHLWAAMHFARLARDIEQAHTGKSRFDEAHRAYVTNAVLSAAAFLEASINEVFDDVLDEHKGFTKSLSAEYVRLLTGVWDKQEKRSVERWPVLEKFRIGLLCCGQPAFVKAHQPYQDADVLIDLRNELTHARPKTGNITDLDKLSKNLKPKFESNRLMKGSLGNRWFPDHCLGAGCADWSVKTARSFADDFFTRVKLVPPYQQMKFDQP